MRASGGTRVPWSTLPGPVRSAVESALGSAVADAVNQDGGFSPGLAARCTLRDGRRVFIKAVSGGQNPHAPRIHRRELEVASLLPPDAAAPALVTSVDDGDWIVLVFEEIEGRQPVEPWTWADLDRVIPVVVDHAEAFGAPVTDGLQRFEARHDGMLDAWARLHDGDGDARDYGDAVVARIPDLARLEAGWRTAAAGDRLIHADLRADNILVTDEGRVVFVDWPWACAGAPVCEVALLLPSIGLGGGPPIGDVITRFDLEGRYGRRALASLVCAAVGYFVRASLDPAPVGLPTVRDFQRAQARVGLDWLLAPSGPLDAPE